MHSAHGGDFYQDPAFLTGGYFPELDAHKLLLTDVMEMYPQPEKSPTSAMESTRYGPPVGPPTDIYMAPSGLAHYRNPPCKPEP